MTERKICLALGTLLLGAATGAIPALAQNSQLPLPPPVEKELASRASNVTEVTLGKNMLGFAAKFMNGKDQDEAATRRLIENLDGIYVREYEFDKDGQYSLDDIEKLRQYFETTEWSPIVRERERHSGETTDVMVKLVNGEPHGMFVLAAESRELTIVLILGPVRMEDLGKLRGIAGLGGPLGALNGMQAPSHGRSRDKEKDKAKDKDKDKEKDKDKDKDKKDGAQ
jgi:hypothetical protein